MVERFEMKKETVKCDKKQDPCSVLDVFSKFITFKRKVAFSSSILIR